MQLTEFGDQLTDSDSGLRIRYESVFGVSTNRNIPNAQNRMVDVQNIGRTQINMTL